MLLVSKNKVRYLTCFVVWLALFTFYAMRSNISIAMLAMTKQIATENSTSFSSCIVDSGASSSDDKHVYPFEWSQQEQGYVLSAFFVGYFSSHILGAIFSVIIGPRLVMIICLVGATIATFSMTILPFWGVWYLIIGRALIGFFSGPLYPLVHQLVANYAPEDERTIIASVTHTGNIVGLCFNFGVGGYIVEHFQEGWKYLFYLNTLLGVLALVLWLIFVYSTPKENPFMSEMEIKLISGQSHGDDSHSFSFKDIPFSQILTSSQVYIVCFATFSNSIILFSLLTGFPKYLSGVYGIKKSTASYLAIIPFMSNFIFQMIYPQLVNFNTLKSKMSKTTYRRMNSAIGFIGSSIFLGVVGFIPCEHMFISILFIALSMIFLGANQSGFFTAMIDLSPKFSGMIMGIACTFGSLSGIIQPQITSYLIKDGDKKIGYLLAFVITSVACIVFATPFILFGSSEEQEWNKKNSKSKVENLTLIASP